MTKVVREAELDGVDGAPRANGQRTVKPESE
jgi:hypothetical protein